jgi:hypothetical protein
LSFETKNRAVDIWLAEQDAGVVDEVARGEVVGAVDDDVMILKKFQGILAGEFCFVGCDVDVRI